MPQKRPGSLRGRIPRQTHLGAMLRLYRTVQNRTMRELAPELGLSHATLMRIEAGQSFDAETLLKIWAWLRTPVRPVR